MNPLGFQTATQMLSNQYPLESILNADISKADRRQIVAQEFESVFINQMLKQMDETVNHEDNLLYAGKAEDMYRGLFNQELSKMMARNGGIGLSDMLVAEMEKNEIGKG